MNKKILFIYPCFMFAWLLAAELELKSVDDDVSYQNYEDIKTGVDELIQTTSKIENESIVKSFFAHLLITGASYLLANIPYLQPFTTIGVNREMCALRENAYIKATLIFMLSYIFIRSFYMTLCKKHFKNKNEKTALKDLEKFIQERFGEINKLPCREKLLFIKDIEDSIIIIKNDRRISKLITHLMPLFVSLNPPLGLAMDMMAIDRESGESFSAVPFDRDGANDAEDGFRKRRALFYIFRYVALMFFFDYIFVEKDKSADLIEKIEKHLSGIRQGVLYDSGDRC